MTLRWTNLGQFHQGLSVLAERSDQATRQAVADGAALIQRRAMQNSSGRPGPNVVTGAHRRGIAVSGPRRVGTWWEAGIGPTMVYSGVLERRYPYLAPAFSWARGGPLAAVIVRHWRSIV